MKLNGYRATHRNRWFLITKKILNPQEFLLFEYYIDLMDFDRSHGDNFATFEAYLKEVAPVFNKKEDAVRKWHNGLLSKHFIKIVDPLRHLYTVKSPFRYVIGKDQWGGEASQYAKEEKEKQNPDFILQNICFFQPQTENIQLKSVEKTDISANTTENSLSSSKNNSMVNQYKVVVIPPIVRSEEEYQKMFADNSDFSIENMKLADECTAEEQVIENEEQEKKIVDESFNGDWDEYKKHTFYRTKHE